VEVRQAHVPKSGGGKLAVPALDFLQTENVWLGLHNPTADRGGAETDRIDVPTGDSKHASVQSLI
jgi:hypothetical protein